MSIRDRLPFYILTLGLLSATMACNSFVYELLLGEDISDSQPTEGDAPDFELTTFAGETITLTDLRGNIVVLNFWASWCTECRYEAPVLQSAWERYQDHGVIFVGVAYADNGPRSLEFIDEFGITYLNGLDTGTRISDTYNITGVPETFIIDRNGNIVEFFIGPSTEKRLISGIETLLNE